MAVCVASGKICSIGKTTIYENVDMQSLVEPFLKDWNEELHRNVFLKQGEDNGK